MSRPNPRKRRHWNKPKTPTSELLNYGSPDLEDALGAYAKGKRYITKGERETWLRDLKIGRLLWGPGYNPNNDIEIELPPDPYS